MLANLANAYGSVHHSLIQFSLRHYHAPPQFLSVLQALYSGLSVKVMTHRMGDTYDFLTEGGVSG
jgi:hypothetical protein